MKDIKNRLVTITKWMEIVIAILLIVVIIGFGFLFMYESIFINKEHLLLEDVLQGVLGLVVGIEFVKMLLLHTPESVLEVLLYAVARQIVISHDQVMDNLIGVIAVAIIFIVRRYTLKGKE